MIGEDKTLLGIMSFIPKFVATYLRWRLIFYIPLNIDALDNWLFPVSDIFRQSVTVYDALKRKS